MAIAADPGPAISMTTWMEVMVGAPPEAAEATRAFLEGFARGEIDADVAEAALRLRKARRLKVPDAIILASAEVIGAVLVTRNTRDFGEGGEMFWMPYRL